MLGCARRFPDWAKANSPRAINSPPIGKCPTRQSDGGCRGQKPSDCWLSLTEAQAPAVKSATAPMPMAITALLMTKSHRAAKKHEAAAHDDDCRLSRETCRCWYRGAHCSLHRKTGRYVPIVALTPSWVLLVPANDDRTRVLSPSLDDCPCEPNSRWP